MKRLTGLSQVDLFLSIWIVSKSIFASKCKAIKTHYCFLYGSPSISMVMLDVSKENVSIMNTQNETPAHNVISDDTSSKFSLTLLIIGGVQVVGCGVIYGGSSIF